MKFSEKGPVKIWSLYCWVLKTGFLRGSHLFGRKTTAFRSMSQNRDFSLWLSSGDPCECPKKNLAQSDHLGPRYGAKREVWSRWTPFLELRWPRLLWRAVTPAQVVGLGPRLHQSIADILGFLLITAEGNLITAQKLAALETQKRRKIRFRRFSVKTV